MEKGKYKALENLYRFSSVNEDDAGYIYVPEKKLKHCAVIKKDEIIDYKDGLGRISRNGSCFDILFERIYKIFPESFEFLGELVK